MEYGYVSFEIDFFKEQKCLHDFSNRASLSTRILDSPPNNPKFLYKWNLGRIPQDTIHLIGRDSR